LEGSSGYLLTNGLNRGLRGDEWLKRIPLACGVVDIITLYLLW